MPLLLSHDLYLKHVCYVLFSKYSKKYQFVLYASRSRETGAVQQVGCGGYGVVLGGRKHDEHGLCIGRCNVSTHTLCQCNKLATVMTTEFDRACAGTASDNYRVGQEVSCCTVMDISKAGQ